MPLQVCSKRILKVWLLHLDIVRRKIFRRKRVLRGHYTLIVGATNLTKISALIYRKSPGLMEQHFRKILTNNFVIVTFLRKFQNFLLNDSHFHRSTIFRSLEKFSRKFNYHLPWFPCSRTHSKYVAPDSNYSFM